MGGNEHGDAARTAFYGHGRDRVIMIPYFQSSSICIIRFNFHNRSILLCTCTPPIISCLDRPTTSNNAPTKPLTQNPKSISIWLPQTLQEHPMLPCTLNLRLAHLPHQAIIPAANRTLDAQFWILNIRSLLW